MISPWRFIVGPQFEAETQLTLTRLNRELTDALKARDEKKVRSAADDLDEIDHILDRIRALLKGTHPDLLDLRPATKLTLPDPFTVRTISIGRWVAFFRIQDPPPQGWALCILPKKTPIQDVQARLRSYP